MSVDEFTETTLGETVLLEGENGAVPLALVSTAGLTNLLAEVTVPPGRLSAPTLGGVSPLVGAASLPYVNAPEARLLTGAEPTEPARVKRHADGLVATFLPKRTAAATRRRGA